MVVAPAAGVVLAPALGVALPEATPVAGVAGRVEVAALPLAPVAAVAGLPVCEVGVALDVVLDAGADAWPAAPAVGVVNGAADPSVFSA